MLTFADIMHHYEQGAQGAGLDARQRGSLFALVEAARPVIEECLQSEGATAEKLVELVNKAIKSYLDRIPDVA